MLVEAWKSSFLNNLGPRSTYLSFFNRPTYFFYTSKKEIMMQFLFEFSE